MKRIGEYENQDAGDKDMLTVDTAEDTFYEWEINTIPSHNNPVNNTARSMNKWGALPRPFGRIARIQKKRLTKMLKNVVGIEFEYSFSILYGNISGCNLDLSNAFILDYAPVVFGKNVVVGRDVKLITSWHPVGNFNTVYAKTIHIGDNVWLTMNIIVLPGVTIGNNSVIGAGSVVTRSIPDNVFAAGNPAKVVKIIDRGGT